MAFFTLKSGVQTHKIEEKIEKKAVMGEKFFELCPLQPCLYYVCSMLTQIVDAVDAVVMLDIALPQQIGDVIAIQLHPL